MISISPRGRLIFNAILILNSRDETTASAGNFRIIYSVSNLAGRENGEGMVINFWNEPKSKPSKSSPLRELK